MGSMSKVRRWALGAVLGAAAIAAQGGAQADGHHSAQAVAKALEGTDQGHIFRAIKDQFPGEYAQFTQTLADRANAGASQQELGQMGFAFTSGLRRENADLAAGASDETIDANISTMLKITQALSDDPRTCAEYSIIGGSALLGNIQSPELVTLFSENSGYSFKAIAEGRRAGETGYADPTESDWMVFFDHWRAQGVTDAELDVFFANDPANPDMCRLSIGFLEALLSAPGESGAALRRFMVIQTLKT